MARKRTRYERCPICSASLPYYLLDWHLAKNHDEGTPAVLEAD
jgi:hypothetical protein